MIDTIRNTKNPLLRPNPKNPWEAHATLNGSVIVDNNTYHMLYRAISSDQDYEGRKMQVSTIGHAVSADGVTFTNNEQLIKPEETWEKFGCEDPRITKIDNEYFVFYTALSDYPFYPAAIKIGMAHFSAFGQPLVKHLVTPFNAKAMVLFPKKINGKYVALLTVHTDMPPAKICIATFTNKEEMWSQAYWHTWYQHIDDFVLPLQRLNSDQVEVGAVPVYTRHGWLFLYAHIQHYYDEKHRTFGVEALLLDIDNPQKIIARTEEPILVPQTDYEKNGIVANVVFPSGATLVDDTISLYYGASDTYCCVATLSLKQLVHTMQFHAPVAIKVTKPLPQPMLMPDAAHDWESKAVFNPAVFFDGKATHMLYRAMGNDNTSVFGHAESIDGLSITNRSEMPAYIPRMDFESKKNPDGNSGCEDPRMVRINNTLYVCYTTYDGVHVPRVALTTISVENFLAHNFLWSEPMLISPPGIDDKDAALFPEKIKDKYVFVHRIQNSIVLDFVDDLKFGNNTWLRSIAFIPPRGDSWDSEKIGLCAPPIKTKDGWFLLYHGVSKSSHEYRVGAMLLDLLDPSRVLSRTPWPILEPELPWERNGIVRNVVFPCGVALRDDTLFLYYGGADTVIGVATISFSLLVAHLRETAKGISVSSKLNRV